MVTRKPSFNPDWKLRRIKWICFAFSIVVLPILCFRLDEITKSPASRIYQTVSTDAKAAVLSVYLTDPNHAGNPDRSHSTRTVEHWRRSWVVFQDAADRQSHVASIREFHLLTLVDSRSIWSTMELDSVHGPWRNQHVTLTRVCPQAYTAQACSFEGFYRYARLYTSAWLQRFSAFRCRKLYKLFLSWYRLCNVEVTDHTFKFSFCWSIIRQTLS